MTEKTIITTEKIADYLKIIMYEKNITAQDLIKKGIANQKVYSVLRMGKPRRPNYSINTFIEVLGSIGVYLEIQCDSNETNGHSIFTLSLSNI